MPSRSGHHCELVMNSGAFGVSFATVHTASAYALFLAMVASKPKHPAVAPSGDSSSLQPWLIAIFGTVSASLFAIVIQFGTMLLQGRKDLSYIRGAVRSEVVSIRSICDERLQLPAGRIVVVPPFPTSAWHALTQSPQRSRISKNEAETWNSLFRIIEMANAEIAIVPYFIQIAALAKDIGERENYLKEAIALSRKHLDEIDRALNEYVKPTEASSG
jgi:hypothetical protein